MPTPTTQFFTGRMPFLPPNQQRQSTEGNHRQIGNVEKKLLYLSNGLVAFHEILQQDKLAG